MQEEDEEEGSGQGLRHTTQAAWTQMKLACFLVCVHAVLISPTKQKMGKDSGARACKINTTRVHLALTWGQETPQITAEIP